MLPTTRINLDSVNTDLSGLIGHVFLFEWSPLIEVCKKANMSLDRFLTIRLASFITGKKYKTPILILFGPAGDCFKLTICTKGNIDFLPCLHFSSGMPGFVESGTEYVVSSARCFLYYNGEKLVRTYQPLEWPLEGETFASDFGDQFFLNVFSVEEEFYELLVANPTEHPEYSFVPRFEVENVVTPQSNFEVHYSFIQFN